jgi:eukaryotic-like serine/threonine-protein kinase
MEWLDGRYVLDTLAGKGGMAEVWRAYDRVLRRTVAVKVLSHRPALDTTSSTQIRREALTAAKLCHPNIAGVYDYGETVENGRLQPFLVLEYVDGPTLAGRIAENGPLT